MRAVQKYLSGFSLIELMIVIAIISILAAISFTIYSNFFKMSFESEAMSVFEQAKLAQTQYMAEHNEYACNINDLPRFNDSSPADGTYVLNPDKAGKRRFILTANCTNNNATYSMRIYNNPSDSEMDIEWTLTCGQGQPSPCEPTQIKGTSSLGNL